MHKLVGARHRSFAQGRIVRVELVTGDRNAAHCLQTALAGLSSATVANGTTPAAATVEITLHARR